MSERRLRRRCRVLLRELDVRPPLDVPALCGRLAEHRGKPIHLLPHPIEVPGPFGMWLSSSRADYIVYQGETTRPHQVHIVLHELGHLIADHRSDTGDDEMLQKLHLSVSPEVLRRELRRTSYDDAQEVEAETVATIILQWASVLDPLAGRLPRTEAGRRLDAGLADRIGWL